MPPRIAIKPYRAEHEPAVRAFNQRMLAGGTGLLLPEQSRATLPSPDSRAVRTFLALEDDVVRGGYGLRGDQFDVDGKQLTIEMYLSPVSEGIVDPRLAAVGAQLLLDAMRRGSGTYAVGGGGLDTQSVKLYRAARWHVRLIPFFFHVLNGRSFLRNISFLRRRKAYRIAADIGSATGLGTMGLGIIHRLQALRHRMAIEAYSIEETAQFDEREDEVWAKNRSLYSFTQSRTSSYLNRLFHHVDPHVVRLRVVSARGRILGWVLLVTGGQPFADFFGSMRVGMILDGFCSPADASTLISAATRHLAEVGMDIAISNQWHPAWQDGLRSCGYLEGPSNLPLGLSPGLIHSVLSLDNLLSGAHLNRGNGDGIVLGPRRALPDGVRPNPKTLGMAQT